MTDSRLQALLAELVATDPSLRGRERDLEPLLAELVASRPDADIDPAFMRRLRERLLNLPKPAAPMPAPAFSWFKPLALAAGGLIALVIAVPILRQDASPTATSVATALPPGAFGSLAGSQPSPLGLGGDAAISARAPAPAAMMAESATSPSAGNAAVAADAKMMVPPDWTPIRHAYGFEGEMPAVDAEGEVYRRTGVPFSSPALASALARLKVGPVDLGAFSNLTPGSIEVREDRKDGYAVYLNAYDGSVSVSQNWEMWDQPDWSVPLTQDMLLSDEEALRLADAFLREYRIDVSGYGAPLVQPGPYAMPLVKEMAADAAARIMPYVSDSVTVTYPMLVAGLPVVYEDGSPAGLQVTVSARYRAVTNATIPAPDRLEPSAYALEADPEAIRKVMGRGGLNAYEPEDGKVVAVALGEPRRVLMDWWKWDGNASTRLLIPALRFPVAQPPEDEPYFRQAVVVPLVKEVLDGAVAQPPVTIMGKPMAEPAIEPMMPR